MFARLVVFIGGFDFDAAEAVAGGGDVERFQVLDLLTLLVDKCLVVAESASGLTRYRLLETVRQYALEKLGESGQADAVLAWTTIFGRPTSTWGANHGIDPEHEFRLYSPEYCICN